MTSRYELAICALCNEEEGIYYNIAERVKGIANEEIIPLIKKLEKEHLVPCVVLENEYNSHVIALCKKHLIREAEKL